MKKTINLRSKSIRKLTATSVLAISMFISFSSATATEKLEKGKDWISNGLIKVTTTETTKHKYRISCALKNAEGEWKTRVSIKDNGTGGMNLHDEGHEGVEAKTEEGKFAELLFKKVDEKAHNGKGGKGGWKKYKITIFPGSYEIKIECTASSGDKKCMWYVIGGRDNEYLMTETDIKDTADYKVGGASIKSGDPAYAVIWGTNSEFLYMVHWSGMKSVSSWRHEINTWIQFIIRTQPGQPLSVYLCPAKKMSTDDEIRDMCKKMLSKKQTAEDKKRLHFFTGGYEMSIADEANYDETKVSDYELPSALINSKGHQVSDAFEWINSQRRYIMGLFEQNMYGRALPRPDEMRFEILSVRSDALGGLAVRKEVRIHCQMKNGREHCFDVLLYMPKQTITPIPAFAGLNFLGNYTTTAEEDVRLPECPQDHKKTATRGSKASRWQFEELIKRGYASATVFCYDIFRDEPSGFPDSIYALFEADTSNISGGAINAWAWGLSRVYDYLETEPGIDSLRVAVYGHSRLGKAALWAGAVDQRFGMVISNNSGCGGAALSRRIFGETIECFPLQNVGYWFLPEFYVYAGQENNLPFDQHMLISLMAPRPVYVASATEDLWADPKGEFLSALNASPVYKLFGNKGLEGESMPVADVSIGNGIGYHIRNGKHDVTEFDWQCYLNFADKIWERT